jgi:hypothetical protein
VKQQALRVWYITAVPIKLGVHVRWEEHLWREGEVLVMQHELDHDSKAQCPDATVVLVCWDVAPRLGSLSCHLTCVGCIPAHSVSPCFSLVYSL